MLIDHCAAKYMGTKELDHTSNKRDAVDLDLEVSNQLGVCSRGITDVNKGQKAKEEVHWKIVIDQNNNLIINKQA